MTGKALRHPPHAPNIGAVEVVSGVSIFGNIPAVSYVPARGWSLLCRVTVVHVTDVGYFASQGYNASQHISGVHTYWNTLSTPLAPKQWNTVLRPSNPPQILPGGHSSIS
jgi:hypothetical protein